MEITINTEAFNNLGDEDAPLYAESNGQLYKAWLYLDEGGDSSIETAAPWEKGVSVDVWNRTTLTWSLPVAVKGNVLQDVLTSEKVLQLLQRVHAGQNVESDSGELNGDALKACAELENVLTHGWDCSDLWRIMSADEWLSEYSLSDIWPNGKSLQEAAKDIVHAAHKNDALCGTTEEMEAALLDKLRERISDDEDFEPTPEQLAALDD
jgi:hypothetical protein